MNRRVASIAITVLAALEGCSCGPSSTPPQPPPPPPATCGTGLTDCGGTCVDLATNASHCGTCEYACPAGQTCGDSVCGAFCAPLLTRCGTGTAATCVDLTSDAAHCGDCATACGAGQGCEGGACVTACGSGQVRCGTSCVDVTVRKAGQGLPGVRASPTSATPVAFLLLDVDGDAVPDLVIAEATSSVAGQVEVLHGAGDGTFVPYSTPSIAPLSFVPASLAAGDVNGDGKLDLAVGTADPLVSSVAILAGDGLGGFTPSGLPAIAAGAGPRAVALADLNRDGVVDLVVGDGSTVTTFNLRIFLNDGVGNLGVDQGGGVPRTANASYTVLADVRDLIVGVFDFPTNSGADILAVSAGTTTAGGEVLIGNGFGGFTQPPLKANAFTLPAAPTATVAADLNGDFVLDWAVAVGDANQVSVFVNQGTGASLAQALNDVAEPLGIAAFDLDSDGMIDLLTANGGDSASRVHPNLGLAAGGVHFGSPTRIPAGNRPAGVAVLPGSGKQWILTVNRDGKNVSAALATGTGYVAPALYPTQISADAIALGRFDGDAWLDVVAASASSDELRLFFQTRPAPPAADFSSSSTITLPVVGAAPSAVAAGDLDGDGKDDVAVALNGTGQLGLLYGNGAGGFEPLVTASVGSKPAAVLIAQLDGIRGVDLATADTGSDRVTVFLSSGPRTHASALPLPTGPSPVALASVDLDGRGCVDLVTANLGDGSISVLRCDPAKPGTFSAPINTPACAGARAVAAALVDGDALPDLVVGCTSGLVVLKGLGAGTFFPGTPFALQLDPAALAIADLDGDGVKDLVVASALGGAVALLRGNGTGGFAAPELFIAGGSPVGLAVAAVDGDGQRDVIAAVDRPLAAVLGSAAAYLRGTCSP